MTLVQSIRFIRRWTDRWFAVCPVESARKKEHFKSQFLTNQIYQIKSTQGEKCHLSREITTLSYYRMELWLGAEKKSFG
jgi:hypothetical protein